MSHPDPEDLALGALEGFSDADTRRHVEQCAACRAEVASLRQVVDAGRAGRPADVTPAAPPTAVWDRIAEELGLPAAAATAAPAPVATDRPTAAEPAPTPPPAATAAPSPGEPARRAWWQRPTAWVAAAALLVGAFGTVLIQRLVSAPEPTVVASADLQPLPGWDGEGSAEVEEQDGERVLVVDLTAAPEQGFREVWLISTDLERLVSLGVLTGSEGRFDLPDGLDLEDFAVVDVSAEPLDGDPAHSGDSIVRGELS